MNELFGPKLPIDIKFEVVQPADSALNGMVFCCTYDEGFDGHFSVPNGDGAAAYFEKVLAQPEPFTFMREHLALRPASGTPIGDELIIFGPGLNTLHSKLNKPGWEGETTTPMRLQHYVDVLKRPMLQVWLTYRLDTVLF
jgi:hypothetical protein